MNTPMTREAIEARFAAQAQERGLLPDGEGKPKYDALMAAKDRALRVLDMMDEADVRRTARIEAAYAKRGKLVPDNILLKNESTS